MKHERISVYGETKEQTVVETVARSIWKFSWQRRQKRMIPPAKFDSRNGDTVPDHIKQATSHWRGVGDLLNIYLYPGEQVENPNFDDIRNNLLGRDSTTKHQTLLCTISVAEGYMFTVSNESVRITFDASVDSPYVTYEYTMKHELFVFPGPWEETVTLCFRDQTQMNSMLHTLNSAEEIPHEAV